MWLGGSWWWKNLNHQWCWIAWWFNVVWSGLKSSVVCCSNASSDKIWGCFGDLDMFFFECLYSIHIHAHTHIHIHIHKCTHLHSHTRNFSIYTYAYIHMHYIRIYKYTCMCIYVYIYTYLCMDILDCLALLLIPVPNMATIKHAD